MAASGWQTLPLKNSGVSFEDGDRSSKYPKKSEFQESGIPFLNTSSTTEFRLDLSQINYITEQKFNQITKGRAQRHDLLLTTRGSNTGKVAVFDCHYNTGLINAQMLILRTDVTRINPQFLFYQFRSPEFQDTIRAYSSGSAQPQLPIKLLKDIPVVVPPLPEQRAIAHILGTLDDKIDLNRKMNQTLEEMARTIFKSWFVDFSPILDVPNDGTVPRSMRREPGYHSQLELVDSELGPIPKGWKTGSLADIADLNPESWSKNTRPNIIHYVDLSNTKWGRIESVAVHTNHKAPSRAQRVLRSGDTIVGTVRPGNGSYALIVDEGLTGSTGFAVLRPHKSEYQAFVYLAATVKENIEVLSNLADGGAYPAVRPEIVISTQAVIPPEDVMLNFSKVSGILLEKMANHESESRTLCKIRETLLPKLLSGEIRIKDAEKFVEAAQ